MRHKLRNRFTGEEAEIVSAGWTPMGLRLGLSCDAHPDVPADGWLAETIGDCWEPVTSASLTSVPSEEGS